MDNSKEARARAEENFKRKEQQARDNEKARSDYDAEGRALRQKTERLKALRLANELNGKATEKIATAKKPSRSAKPK